jgi:FxLD family lantipeptide
MSTPTIEQAVTEQTAMVDPFGLDITFIENTPAAETVPLCGTGDNCGSSCPSACTTS